MKALSEAAPDAASLNPARHRLYLAQLLQYGLYAQAFTLLLPLLFTLVSILGIADGLEFQAQVLLQANRHSISETAMLSFILALVNVCALVVLLVGALAREWWLLLVAGVTMLYNLALLFFWQHLASGITLGILCFALIRARADLPQLRFNPVMRKELRARMRGIRAFVILSIYLSLMSAVAILLYLIFVPQVQATGSVAIGTIGRDLFRGMVALELLLIIFIAPAFTAGSITGERDANTYDLIRMTMIPSPAFIIGKLESAIGYILLLMCATAPLLALAFLFGGVSQLELALSFELVVVTSLLFGAVGMYYSAGAERTLAASVRSYLTNLAFLFAIPLATLLLLRIIETLVGSSTSPVFEAILWYSRDILISLNPFLAALSTQQLLVREGVLTFGQQILASNGAQIPTVAPWISYTLFYLLGSGALVVLTMRRLRYELD